MSALFYWIGIPLILFVILLISFVVKARKDPDVQAASFLCMDIRRYKTYKYIYDEHQKAMQKYGIDSPEANRIFCELFKQVKKTSEWHRYQEFRRQLFLEQRKQECGF